jgi:hypothetical protein
VVAAAQRLVVVSSTGAAVCELLKTLEYIFE